VITVPKRHTRTDGETDGQTTCDRNTALCTKVHRAVKTLISAAQFSVGSRGVDPGIQRDPTQNGLNAAPEDVQLYGRRTRNG